MKSFALILVFALAQFSFVQPLKNDDYILVGSGGGITGRWEFYKLHADGQVLHRANLADVYSPIGKLSRQNTATAFKQVVALKLDSLALDLPANMSYLIEYQQDNVKSKALWGSNTEAKAPQNVIDFYEKLRQTLSSKK